jgi:L-lactate dehydrogenase
VDPHHVHGYVLGEHGDSEVLTWSLVTVGGIPLEEFCRLRGVLFDADQRQRIDHDVRKAAYAIIEGKGATYYGIGSALARIVDVILSDQRAILTVCTPLPESWGGGDVTVSLPHLVGEAGVLATFPPSLTLGEEASLQASAAVVRGAIEGLDMPPSA